MPYYRFCQTLEAIEARKHNEKIEERKYIAMVNEIAAKFIGSMIASTTPLTKSGEMALSEKINKFSILKVPTKKKAPKKELPAGGYELAMNFFSGMERK